MSFWRKYFLDVVLGAAGLSCSLVFFGLALYMGWNSDITPRVANRPKGVLNRAIFYHLPKWMKNNPICYPVAWIGWAYNLTYKECHKGIPGTGTRKGGTEGPLLRCNLDTIIMMRYQTMLFKVGVLVFVLCTFVILPVNYTARCDVERFGEGTCTQRPSLSRDSFLAATTIDNIPDKVYNPFVNVTVNRTFEINDLLIGINEMNGTIVVTQTNNTNDAAVEFINERANEVIRFLDNQVWIQDQTWRVLVTVVSCAIIYVYSLYLLTMEWIENVALRRKYYLEATHYSQRMSELNKMAFEKKHRENDPEVAENDLENCLESDQVLATRLRRERIDESTILPEHLTHPEVTETPPSVGIFSVLYQFPPSMVTYDTEGATTIERQLVATTNFFDEIIPPETGFSSSVAAVTILPNAKLLARAKSKWKYLEKKLQKLRYVRKKLRIAEEKQSAYEQKERERMRGSILSDAEASNAKYEEKPPIEQVGKRSNPDGSIESISSNEKSEASHLGKSMEQEVGKNPKEIEITSMNVLPSPMRPTTAKDSSEFQDQDTASIDSDTTLGSQNAPVFRYDDFNVMEYASSIGLHEEAYNTFDFVQSMGIEELNVFAFDCAQIAGKNPGFDKRIFNQYGIETLRELEIDLMNEIREANQELLQARKEVAIFGDEKELEDTEVPLQPEVLCDDDDIIIKHYGHCESAGRYSTTIRRRGTVGNGPDDAAATFVQNTSSVHGNDAEFNSARKPKLSMIQRLWSTLKCIFLIPKRIYCGKDGTDDFRERLKYYGTKESSDGEKGGSHGFVTNLERPSYAVVTFTTRHAAVIARQCLADGAPRNRWKPVDDIPLYPLADAPPWGIMYPVTPTITYASKKLRGYIVIIFSCVFIVANVYILDLIDIYIINPRLLSKTFGISLERAEDWSSTASGAAQTLLFSTSPYLFEILANIEGSATSMGKAERNALIYFWYFYLVSRFLGKIVWDAWISFWDGSKVEDSINSAITELSRTATTTLGPLAWTYIIYNCTLSFPVVYFLQFPNLGTRFLGLKWFNRMMKSGGPGTDANYRIYADSGYIFACMTALAPICPLLGFACLLYFIIIIPMLRWLMVFTYRPKWDGGGDKWPQLHHMIVSSLMLGQLITSITLFLKGNSIEGFFIAFWIIPTALYNKILIEKYSRPFEDAALLQTRRMYSSCIADPTTTQSWLEREEYRRWLVDCHKASYLPTCLSGGRENLLTVEPAVVISDGITAMRETADSQDDGLDDKEVAFDSKKDRKDASKKVKRLLKRQKAQKGGILHRQRFNL